MWPCSPCPVSLCHMYCARLMNFWILNNSVLSKSCNIVAELIWRHWHVISTPKIICHTSDLPVKQWCFCYRLQTASLRWLSEFKVCQTFLKYFFWLSVQNLLYSVTLEVTYTWKEWEKCKVHVTQKHVSSWIFMSWEASYCFALIKWGLTFLCIFLFLIFLGEIKEEL